MTTQAPTYIPTQAPSPTATAIASQIPEKAAAPASPAWSPNCVVTRHNGIVQRINNWSCFCKCVVRLEITKDSSKLGDVAKISFLALANLGLAFYDVAKGAFSMVKGIVTKVLCCYKKATPAPGSTPSAPTQANGSTPPAPTQASGSTPPAPTQASGSTPQRSGSPARAQSPAPIPAPDFVDQAGLDTALEPLNEILNDHIASIRDLRAQFDAINTAFNHHLGTNAKKLTGLTDSFAELSTNLGVLDNRGSALARAQEALKTRFDLLEGVVQTKVLPFNPTPWLPRTADTSSSSTTSTSPATSSSSSSSAPSSSSSSSSPATSSSSSAPSSSPAMLTQLEVDAKIAEMKQTPVGVATLTRMFSKLAAEQKPSTTTL